MGGEENKERTKEETSFKRDNDAKRLPYYESKEKTFYVGDKEAVNFLKDKMKNLEELYGKMEIIEQKTIKAGSKTRYSLIFLADNVETPKTQKVKKDKISILYNEKGESIEGSIEKVE